MRRLTAQIEGILDNFTRPLARLEESLRANLGIWNEHGDDNARHNLSGAPELEVWS